MRMYSVVLRGLTYTLLASGCGGLVGGAIGGLVGVGYLPLLEHPERAAVIIVFAYLPAATFFGIYGMAVGIFLGFIPSCIVGNLLWIGSALWVPLQRPWLWALIGAVAGKTVNYLWPIGSQNAGTNADLLFPTAWIVGGAVSMFVFALLVLRLHFRKQPSEPGDFAGSARA